jgi:2',3'-cyclic-nucleotide 2'-phosphodiesterase (5'-nucleotidase family)
LFVFLGPYPTYIQQKDTGRQVPVVQAFYYSKYVGHLQLHFDQEGELKRPVDGNGVVVKRQQE